MNGTSDGSSRFVSWIYWFDRIVVKGALFKGAATLAGLGAVAILALALITGVDVIARNTPVTAPWIGGGGFEMSQLLMTQLSCLTLAWCWYTGGHIRIGLVLERVSPRVRNILNAFASLLGAVCLGFTTWAIAMLSMSSMEMNTATTLLVIRFWPLQLVFSIALGLFTLVCIRSMVSYIARALGHSIEPWTIDPRDIERHIEVSNL